MNRAATIVLAVFLLALPAGSRAQTPPPSHTYTDPAMSFTAPSDFIAIPMPSSTTAPDAYQAPTLVAAYVRRPKQTDRNLITLTIENYTDDLQSFEQDSESEVRNQGSGGGGGSDSDDAPSAFVKKQLTTLPNGMPAYFLDVTITGDSGQSRIFEYVWVDNVRGVTLAVSGGYGTLDANSAKKILSNVSAVAYPRNQF